MHPRLQRDQKTLDLMIEMYCRDKHDHKKDHENKNCADCTALKEYAHLRLEKCPYQEQKTICANCLTHCYQKAMREKVREVMIYAGPRMLILHPILTIHHLIDGFRKPVPLKRKKAK